jgi:hypothetical protein
MSRWSLAPQNTIADMTELLQKERIGRMAVGVKPAGNEAGIIHDGEREYRVRRRSNQTPERAPPRVAQ